VPGQQNEGPPFARVTRTGYAGDHARPTRFAPTRRTERRNFMEGNVDGSFLERHTWQALVQAKEDG